MPAVKKLSDISIAGGNPALSDTVVGVTAGNVDVRQTYTQIASRLTGSVGLTVGTTGITSGTDKRLLYDNAGVLGETADITFTASGTLSLGTVTSPTPNTELIMEQTGDGGGTTRLRLQNRGGSNGAVFENVTLDLVDFGFKPSSGYQANMRFEHRDSAVQVPNRFASAGGASGEFQFALDTTGGSRSPLSFGRYTFCYAQDVYPTIDFNFSHADAVSLSANAHYFGNIFGTSFLDYNITNGGFWTFTKPTNHQEIVDLSYTRSSTFVNETAFAIHPEFNASGGGGGSGAIGILGSVTMGTGNTDDWSYMMGQQFSVTTAGGSSGNVGTMFGNNLSISQGGSGTIGAAICSFVGGVQGGGAGNIGALYGIQINHTSVVDVSNIIGQQIFAPGGSGMGNVYGLIVADHSAIGAGVNFNILSQGANSQNIFEGHVTVGYSAAPSFALDVVGTAYEVVSVQGQDTTGTTIRFGNNNLAQEYDLGLDPLSRVPSFFLFDETNNRDPFATYSDGGDGFIETYKTGVFSWCDDIHFAAYGSRDTGLSRLAAGVVAVGNGTQGDVSGQANLTTLAVQGVTIAGLPGTPAAGMQAYITDGDAALAWGATAVNSGAGATKYMVWYNGTNWKVMGK